jgi:hypothetical protein
VLEPGGTFCVIRKMPPADQVAHEQVMQALKEVSRKLDAVLNAAPPAEPI